MDVHYSSKTDMWATPQAFFDELAKKHNFVLDVCTVEGNTKCPYFITPHIDALTVDWHEQVTDHQLDWPSDAVDDPACYMNPPYGRQVGKWVKKAYETAQAGTKVVCLLPSRTDTKWFHDYCKKGKIEFLQGRLYFNNQAGRAPFPSMLVVFEANK